MESSHTLVSQVRTTFSTRGRVAELVAAFADTGIAALYAVLARYGISLGLAVYVTTVVRYAATRALRVREGSDPMRGINCCTSASDATNVAGAAHTWA
jgi:hypothetical protein